MLSVNFAHMISKDFISKLLIWRIKHIKSPTFVIVLSVVIGVLAGEQEYTTGGLIKNLVDG